ncbi:hypothetical protein OROHE_012468 [Orobanche hederae]
MHIHYHLIVRAEKRNAQKWKAYASMDIQRKLSLLDSKRVKYRHQVGNTGEALPSTSYQRTFPQHKRHRCTSLPEHRLRTRPPKGFCCLHGQISLALTRMPQRLWELYTSLESTAAVHFRRHCRTYNNTTAFSSLGIRYDETLVKSNKGIYTLRIQGAVYHFIRDLLPAEGHGRQLQLYFYEPEHELQNRLSHSGDLDVHILEDIIDLMRLNPYAMFLRGLLELVNLEEYNIVLRADPSLDMRIYNLPTVNQVAAIWNEMTDVHAVQPHDIREYTECHSFLLLLMPGLVNNAAVRRLFILAVTFLENLFLLPSLKIWLQTNGSTTMSQPENFTASYVTPQKGGCHSAVDPTLESTRRYQNTT